MSAPRLQLLGLRLGHAIESLQQLACCTRRRTRQAYAQYLLRELRELQAEAVALQLTVFDEDSADDDDDGGRDAELLAAVVAHQPRELQRERDAARSDANDPSDVNS